MQSDLPNHQLHSEANKEFYAATAHGYDKLGNGMTVNMADENAKAILERISDIDRSSTQIMDFAAGTGSLSMLLAPHCKSVTAVDLSEEMINVLQSKIGREDATVDNIVPVAIDLLAPEAQHPNALDGKLFDVVTCTNAFHHFADPARVTQVLSHYLKPGGKMAIADLIKDDKSQLFHMVPITEKQEDGSHRQVFGDGHGHHDHGHSHSHGHQKEHHHVVAWQGGFTQDQMREFFESAGLSMLDMRKSTEFHKNGGIYDVFLAIAEKPKA